MTNQEPPSSPPRRALVVQGGGMRGAYAAGALIQLFEEHPRPFDAVWATSSGAASTAYAVAGQPEGLEIWRQHLHGDQLLSIRRGLRGGPLLDLDYLIDEVFRRRIPLDVQRLHRNDVPVQVPMTDVREGSVAYRDLSKEDPFPILRAAMSLPGAVHRAVQIGENQYVDGGVVDQIPIGRAIASGATDIVCIMTRPLDQRAKPVGRLSLRLATKRFPNLRRSLEQRHRLYEQELRLLLDPPKGIRLTVIKPDPRLRIKRWTRNRARILEAIEAGRRDALNRSKSF